MRPTAARRCRPVPVPDSAAATNIPWVERPRTPDREPRKSSPADSPPLRTARVVPECPHSSTSSLIAPPRSLRSRRSVKDVPEHCVKDVMELNTGRLSLREYFCTREPTWHCLNSRKPVIVILLSGFLSTTDSTGWRGNQV